MVSKKILSVAIAAAFLSQGAFAVIDGVAANNVTYAKETILTGDISVLPATVGLVNVVAAATELDFHVPIGFGVTASTHAFVRYDLTNAKFKVAVASGDGTTGDLTGPAAGSISSVTVAQGGQIGDTYVILDVTAGASGLAQSDILKLNVDGLAISPTAPVSVTFNHYSTSLASVGTTAPAGALSTKTLTSAVSVIENLKATITAGTDLVADVNGATPFKTFTVGGATGVFGTLKFEAADANARLASTGALVSALPTPMFDRAAGKSTLAVTGDLSFTSADAGAGAAVATSANLTFGAVVSDVSTPATSTTPSAKLTTLTAAAFDIGAAAVNISATSNGSINAGAYSLTFTPAMVAGRQYAPTGVSKALASVTRNGATAQVPYLTTNAGLNQKLILVNRGATATTYSISFTPEAGVTAVAKTAAAGTLAAKETKILKAVDVVTLTGGTRTAATVVALSPAGNIDAATQTVVTDPASVSYGSNDTVNLSVK